MLRFGILYLGVILSVMQLGSAAPNEQNNAVVSQTVQGQASQPAATQTNKLAAQSVDNDNQESEITPVDKRIPAGTKLFVAPMDGFDAYVIAGLQKKRVPVTVVADRSKADFEISGVSDSEKAGWAKMLFLGSTASREEASVKVVNLKTGVVVFAYSVHKGNSARGKQSAGEACAKHIKEKIEGRQP